VELHLRSLSSRVVECLVVERPLKVVSAPLLSHSKASVVVAVASVLLLWLVASVLLQWVAALELLRWLVVRKRHLKAC